VYRWYILMSFMTPLSITQPLCYWPKLTSSSVTKLQERLKFKFVLRKKSKEIPSAHKPEKDQGSHSPVPLLGPPIYVWRYQGLLKKRQKAYCVEELRRTKTERPTWFRTLVQIIALLLVYRHLHRKYKIYCSKTRCKTARKTIEYLQNAVPVS